MNPNALARLLEADVNVPDSLGATFDTLAQNHQMKFIPSLKVVLTSETSSLLFSERFQNERGLKQCDTVRLTLFRRRSAFACTSVFVHE
jgi:hypothetical protein